MTLKMTPKTDACMEGNYNNSTMKNIWVMKTIKYYYFDIIGLSEVNKHWPLVKPIDSWEKRISVHWEYSNSVMAFNLEDDVTKL